MIKSKLIADIVKLLLYGYADHIAIHSQKELITDTVCGYTSKGLFVAFSHTDDIIVCKSTIDNLILTGIKITSAGFNFEAEATLFFRKGIIDCLEISATTGNYPQQELTEYTLTLI